MEEYKLQLRQVEDALQVVKNPTELKSLQSLQADLKELIELTKQTTELNNEEETNNMKPDKFQDQMEMFVNEVNQIDNVNSTDKKKNEEELLKELQSMVGHKCSAPHTHTWGAIAYHNAIICGIEEIISETTNSNNICMQILFTNPTHREMVPCSYFLEGECRFDSEKCHFSHGELVPFTELKEYKEPEFEKLARNCIVLAKMKDRIWYKGRVLQANFERKSCRVRLENQQKEIDFPFEDLFPIFHDDDLSDDDDDNNGNDTSDTLNSDSETIDDLKEAYRANLIEKNLFSYTSSQPIGEWEKYTKGIGSKLMSKMGYIHGTGLGSDGKGIITPITAQILPQGKSLDYCMKLREAANGDQNLFSVEKKLKTEQKKQEIFNAKAYERECKKIDVFSFLNSSILTNPNIIDKKKKNLNQFETKNSFKNQTTKNLNVESVKIADDIRKKEKEISKVKQSMGRHSLGSEVHKRLQAQLTEKNQELGGLKKAEISLAKEQASRKTKDKLSVF